MRGSPGNAIDDLRALGYSVRVRHWRPGGCAPRWVLELVGGRRAARLNGATIVLVTRGQHEFFEGVALCGPRDQFVRRVGLRVALGRALKEAGLEQYRRGDNERRTA